MPQIVTAEVTAKTPIYKGVLRLRLCGCGAVLKEKRQLKK